MSQLQARELDFHTLSHDLGAAPEDTNFPVLSAVCVYVYVRSLTHTHISTDAVGNFQLPMYRQESHQGLASEGHKDVGKGPQGSGGSGAPGKK